MPMHDWNRVEAGIFFDFHQTWSMQIRDSLNRDLPADHYALIEQSLVTQDNGRFGPDILTLHSDTLGSPSFDNSAGTTVLAPAPAHFKTVKTDAEFYRRKKNIVAIRHVSDDRIVACIELVSPGNKSGQRAFKDFVVKSCELLMRGIHLVIVDVFPPGMRDPQGVHNAIWEELHGEPDDPLPAVKDRVAVSYECEMRDIHAYPETLAVGVPLPEVPVFLRPGGCVMLNLEETYAAAFKSVPLRWRRVIEA